MNIKKIPPENGGSNLLSMNFLWNDVFFLSLIKFNLLKRKLKIKIVRVIIIKLALSGMKFYFFSNFASLRSLVIISFTKLLNEYKGLNLSTLKAFLASPFK